VDEIVKITEVEISSKGDKNKTENLQGVMGEGDISLKGFEIKGAKIAVGKQVARTEKEIELEITRKKKSLERKNKMLDSHVEKGNDEAVQRVEKEIEKLEEEIDNLELELQQAQIEVNK